MRRALFLAALLLLIACAHAPVPIPDADSVIAELPTYTVGDEWRFRGAGYQSRVWITEVTSDTVVSLRERPARLETCAGCRFVRDRNLTVVRVLGPDGAPRPEIGIGVKVLDFPLRVGKAWTTTGGGYRDRFVVEAFETVTVPAGTFRAFRIRQHQENLTSGWRGTAALWWSPATRWFVQLESLRGQGLGSSNSAGPDLALESYSLK